MADDTIFALSSGAPPAGVAVIRLSGPGVRFGLETLAGDVPPPRTASVRVLRNPRDGAVLDQGIVLYFAGPASFTGEDVGELQVHGGRAVVEAVLGALSGVEGFRPAAAGEFTRRAFVNGRLDLTEVEGLADLIAAETEMQRRQALRQAGGELRRLYDGWRGRIVRLRALAEASLDFAEEEDVPESVDARFDEEVGRLGQEMRGHLDDGGFGERVRDGFEVVLLGPPNVGKSSLLNALARRDAAIVTEEPGTTRDAIEVHLTIGGHAVTLVDTAGLRETGSRVEAEGVRRARSRGAAADLVLLVNDGGDAERIPAGRHLRIRNKADLIDSDSKHSGDGLRVSALTGDGLDALRRAIADALDLDRPLAAAPITRQRQRQGVEAAAAALDIVAGAAGVELKAELLREAGDALGRVTGRIDVEDLLDVIFREFCIGK